MNVQQTMVDVHRPVPTPMEVLYVHVWLDIHWGLIADHAMVNMQFVKPPMQHFIILLIH